MDDFKDDSLASSQTDPLLPIKSESAFPLSSSSDFPSWNERVGHWIKVLQRGADSGVSIMNGVIGDYLHERKNGLAIQMRFYHKGRPFSLSRESLRETFPQLTSKVCILIHGSAADEKFFNFRGEQDTNYGTLLQKDLGYTPFYVRYNSGLRISMNGHLLNDLIQNLYEVYPLPIDEIILVNHSMGGLIARSASYYAVQEEKTWVRRLQKMFHIGAPHHGAPLEKFGNFLTYVLKKVPRPYIQVIADIINLRSAGIKDLRYGYLLDSDWESQDPDALLENKKTPIPLLENVEHYVMNGTLTKNPNHVVTFCFGDFMVRRASATGKHKDPKYRIPFPQENHKEFPAIWHPFLANSPEIYQQIKSWCHPSAASTAAEI